MTRMSHRKKKKSIQDGVSKLRNKPGWNPAGFQRETTAQALRDLEQTERADAVYSEENVCDACLAAREKSSDDTALCEDHFAKLMGF